MLQARTYRHVVTCSAIIASSDGSLRNDLQISTFMFDESEIEEHARQMLDTFNMELAYRTDSDSMIVASVCYIQDSTGAVQQLDD